MRANPIDVTAWTEKDQARFDANITWVPSTGCMAWTTSAAGLDYGRLEYRGRPVYAHRLAWVLANGEPPEGYELDHLCRLRSCVNTDHLEPVTGRVNSLRSTSPAAINAAKVRCERGHEFMDSNLAARTDGGRRCQTCVRIRIARRNELLRAACAALGMGWRSYLSRYGYSVGTAQSIISGTYAPEVV